MESACEQNASDMIKVVLCLMLAEDTADGFVANRCKDNKYKVRNGL